MPGKPIKIGPFTGGLNNISTAGESQDNELVELVNLEVARDESLTSRPPITIIPGSDQYYVGGNADMGWEVLGIYRVSSTEWYLVIMSGTTESSVTDFVIKAYPNGEVGGPAEAAIIIKNFTGVNNKVTGMTQFKDELFFITAPGSSMSGFSWKKGAVATDRPLPKGTLLMSWKTRLWVSGTLSGANADRIWFSFVGETGPDPYKWEATAFFDVAPGEGGFITALIPSFNNLIVFKNDGTWRFSYPSSPKSGSIDKISGQVGAASKYSVVEFENFIYVYDQGYVYELVNSNFSQLNSFVRFKEDPLAVDGNAPGVELSIVNRRLVIRYFNALYVFSVATKAWSMWRTFNGVPGRFQELPVNSARADPGVYIAASRGVTQNQTLNMLQSSSTATVTENTEIFLTSDGTDIFEIPVTPYQKYEFSYTTLEQTGEGTAGYRIRFLKNDGSTSMVNYPLTIGKTQTVSAPTGALLAQISIYTDTVTFVASDISFSRLGVPSPSTLLKITDEYESVPYPVEYIECSMLTKTYDYQAATSFKRLFYWGADLVTPRAILAEARPVGRKNTVTWGDMGKYTWGELSKGTWGNPLSWVNRSTKVVSVTSENLDVSENGRFYVKLKKNLRFRQIAFYLKLTTLGNASTGPAKIFALTTLVNPKKETIDTVT